MEEKELLKLSVNELIDMGVCPNSNFMRMKI